MRNKESAILLYEWDGNTFRIFESAYKKQEIEKTELSDNVLNIIHDKIKYDIKRSESMPMVLSFYDKKQGKILKYNNDPDSAD